MMGWMKGLVLVAMCAWAMPTLAQTEPVDGPARAEDEVDQAEGDAEAEADAATNPGDEEGRALFMAGRHAFDDGRFTEALELFERAQDRSGRASLYYNIGLAADRAGLEARALEAYESFVEGDPTSSRVRMVEARIEILRQSVAEDATAVPDNSATERAVPDPVDPTETPSRRRVWSYVLLGLGASLGAASTGLWLRANREFDDLDQTCAPSCPDDEVDAVDRKVRWTTGTMVGGIAVGLGAVLAFILEGRSVQVDANVSASGGVLGVHGAF